MVCVKALLSHLLPFILFFNLVSSVSVSTYSQQVCYTKNTSIKPSTVNTITFAETLAFPRIVTVTYTPTSTVVPSPTTITAVVTSIITSTDVLPQSTSVFTCQYTKLISRSLHAG